MSDYYSSPSYLRMEARLMASRQRVREQQCAENNGHVRIDSPVCDICGAVAKVARA